MALRLSKGFFVLLLFYLMYFQVVFYPITHTASLLGLSLILTIVYHAYQNKFSVKDLKSVFPFEINLWLLFGITALIIGLFIAPDRSLLINSMGTYFEYVFLLYAIFYLSRVDKKIDFVAYTYIFVVLIGALTATFFGYDYHHGRISMGPRNNPNSLAISMVVAIGLLLFKLNFKKILSIILTFGLIVLFSYVTVNTGSRKAFFALFLIFAIWLGTLIITQYQHLSTKKKILYPLVVLGIVLLLYYYLLPYLQTIALWRRLSRLMNEGDPIRVGMYKEAWQFFKQNPLFGVGYNQFRVLSKYETYSHSTFAEVLACTGLTGFILYFTPYVIILVNLLKSIFKSHQYRILLSLYGALMFLGVGIIHFYGTSSMLSLTLMLAFIYINRPKGEVIYKGKIGVIKKVLKKPRLIIKILGDKKWFNFLPDKFYLKLVYWGETGKLLNLKNPKTYNEKLQWLKLYDRKKEYIQYVDKYEVRKYIKETLGEEYLIPLIAVYDSVEEIAWDKLPQKFVLKCTHGSKANIICKDKSKLAIDKAKKKLKRWMNKNWYYFGREWPYKAVTPRIVCEKYLMDNIIDYKILCFNGVPKLIQVHLNRDSEDYTMDYYTLDWKKTKITKKGVKTTNDVAEKPSNLSEMIEISRTLSKNTYFSRIDLYNVGNKIYFGEITLFPTSGFAPLDNIEDELLLGKWINLPL